MTTPVLSLVVLFLSLLITEGTIPIPVPPAQFLTADEAVTILPRAPSTYPPQLQGVFWMDEGNFFAYGHANASTGLPPKLMTPCLVMTTGDPMHPLDVEHRTLIVPGSGPSWTYENNEGAYELYHDWTTNSQYWTFEFDESYSHVEMVLTPFKTIHFDMNKSLPLQIAAPKTLLHTTMDLITPPSPASAMTCPPSENATPRDRMACGTWTRKTTIAHFDTMPEYIVYRIIDTQGNKIEPYFSSYARYAALQSKPNKTTLAKYGIQVDNSTHKDSFENGTAFISTVASPRLPTAEELYQVVKAHCLKGYNKDCTDHIHALWKDDENNGVEWRQSLASISPEALHARAMELYEERP